jgi:histidinol-phosphatase (PHP family)
MIFADYHMHSHHSGDSKVPTKEMIEASIACGLKKICFTEHNDPDYTYVIPTEAGMFDLDTEKYLNEYKLLKEEYASKIQVGFGVELGVQPGLYPRLSEYVHSYPFDFVIASSHVCKKKDPYWPSYYEDISIKEGIRDYFEEILENVSSFNDYDIYGHLDYIVRYIPEDRKGEYTYRFKDFGDVFEAILKTIIENGKGIELNTAGLHKAIHNTNPCPEIIRFYKELGGELITVGADAHAPEDIRYGFDTAEKILRESGFNHYCSFTGRKPEFHDL